MLYKVTPMIVAQQDDIDMLLPKNTISGNLPFTWIGNKFVKAAFALLRPAVLLPSRRSLSGMLTALLLFYLLQGVWAAMNVYLDLVCQLKQRVELQRSCSRRLSLTCNRKLQESWEHPRKG